MNGTNSVTSISRWGWCSHRDFISSFKLSLTYFVNSVLHLKCKSQQLLYLVYFKFSFVICRMLNGRKTLIVRVNALVKRSVSLAEMNNMIILLLQQYTSFCLYIATVSIKFLLIPQFLFFILSLLYVTPGVDQSWRWSY